MSSLGTLLASIGIPLALKALTGNGLQISPKSSYMRPPPFIGTLGDGLQISPKPANKNAGRGTNVSNNTNSPPTAKKSSSPYP